MQQTQNQELDDLIAMAHTARKAGANDVEHMNGAAAAYNYIRVADLVSSYCRSRNIRGPVLDWGCGYGQVSWLLQKRGINVVSCDAEKRVFIDLVPHLATISIHYLNDPVRLPYDSETYACALSVGVLEHVPNLEGSLQEMKRVLQPNGLFFLFMFPNRFSWAEWIADMRGVSVHPQKFSVRQTAKLLREHGFQVEKVWRRNLLPRNLTGLSSSVKSLYGKYYRQIESLDRLLCALPPAAWFSGVIELIARKE